MSRSRITMTMTPRPPSIRDEMRGVMEEAEEMGVILARRLRDAGADAILKRIYGNQTG